MAGADLFRTRDHVADFDGYVADYQARSHHARASLRHSLNLAYGEEEGARVDLFFPKDAAPAAPIHLFIHGGYWRMFDKSDFSFVAETVCAAGGIAAIMNYDLMPRVRMDAVVRQVRQCANWLVERASAFGGDPGKFTVSGHSAGGHLSYFLLTEDSPVRPSDVLALSGIYDLSPLLQSFLQPDLKFTDDEITQFSPLNLASDGSAAMTLMVGEAETSPFHQQATALRQRMQEEGCRASHQVVEGANHMSIVADLGRADTIPGRYLRGMIA